MSDFTIDQLRQYSLNDLERFYQQGRVSDEQMEQIAALSNETPGRLYWYEWRDRGFRQYDRDTYDLVDGKIRRNHNGGLRVI